MFGSCMNMHKQLANYLRYAEAGNGEISDEISLDHAEGVVSAHFQHPEDVEEPRG
jgi:hypothetical protein